MSLRDPTVAPAIWLSSMQPHDIERAIKWLERQADAAMKSLHCGSENLERSDASAAANAMRAGAYTMRLYFADDLKL